MSRHLLFTLALLGAGLGSAQISVQDIPALPLRSGAPATPAPESAPPAPMVPPTVSTLPARNPPLARPHRAQLVGPATIRAGQPNTWAVTLTNTGSEAIHLEHGACNVRFEVVNAAGQVIRPNPQNTVCTLQLVVTDVDPGQTTELQKIRWEGQGIQGQPLPAGTYTLRSVFDGAGVLIRPADFTVTVR
ncbi:hypothetical protein [Deinococcus aerophilus]|uniref:FlgD Ig-like domain-containing protein n=1 Tax=Deinococcus aerophilus TaxID=522488 RepID=A0ABQ2GHP6_9DEIO|nr:hypothetical protein [Deinococcus aerophilus]GGL95985.1 hypothetical protein GCM10010841_00520 [Deinococcus aerophilus]